jgi:hypothetical protein
LELPLVLHILLTSLISLKAMHLKADLSKMMKLASGSVSGGVTCVCRIVTKSSRIQLYLHEKILCLTYTGLLV